MKYQLSLFLILFISACTSDRVPSEEYTEITLTATDSLVLQDDLSPLDGVIMAYHELNDKAFLIADNKPGIYLFENGTMVRSFGNVGQGPCEFTEISATDLSGTSLYLLSSEQLKIIEFDIASGECINEFSHKAMAGITHLKKEEGADSFLAMRGSYSGTQPDSLTLMYRFSPDESMEYLDLNYGRIDPIPTMISFRTPGTTFVPYRDQFYFYPPQSDSIYRYQPASGALTSFAHEVELNRDEIEQVGQNFQKMMELMQEEVRFIGRIFASENWVAVESVYENIAGGEGQDITLRFYSHDGQFMQALPVSDLIGYQNGHFIQLTEDPADTDYPFRLSYLKPIGISNNQ